LRIFTPKKFSPPQTAVFHRISSISAKNDPEKCSKIALGSRFRPEEKVREFVEKDFELSGYYDLRHGEYLLPLGWELEKLRHTG